MFSDEETTDIKAAAAFVLENFNSGTGTELMTRAHARWPDMSDSGWSTVMISVEVALDFHANQQIADIENGTI